MYHLTVRYSDAKESLPFDWETVEISAPFTKWFTTDGHFIAHPFQQWLASEVPVIGKADIVKANTTSVKNSSNLNTAGLIDLGKSPSDRTRSRRPIAESR